MPEQENATNVSGPIDRDAKVSWEDVKKNSTASEEKPKEEVKVEAETPKPELKSEAVIDYEAELAKYKAKAEREEATRKYERAERKRLEKELESKTEEFVEVDKQVDLDTIVERKLETIRKQEREDVIDDLLLELSDNPHERELVRTVYQERIRPTGYSKMSIKNDLEEAMLIANRSRLESIAFQKAKEKVRTSMAQEKAMLNSASTGGSVGRDQPEATPSYNSNEMRWLGRVGKSKVDGE